MVGIPAGVRAFKISDSQWIYIRAKHDTSTGIITYSGWTPQDGYGALHPLVMANTRSGAYVARNADGTVSGTSFVLTIYGQVILPRSCVQ